MKKLLTEWRKFLKEADLNNEENRERLVRAIAAGLPEDQQPGFMKSETRKLKLDDDYFQRQYEAYEEEMEDFVKEAYYGSIPGEPETPAGYGGAMDLAKVQQHLSDEIDDLVRLGKLNLDDLSIETVRANQEIPWDKFQAIDDEVLGDIIRDYKRRKKFYR